MYKLAYIIPTKNRAFLIDALFNAHKNSSLKLNCCLYILDANYDDETFRIYERNKSDGIIFERMPGTSLSYRFFYALNRVDAEYICLGDDWQFPDFERTQAVINLLDKGYDMADFTMRDRKPIGDKEYYNVKDICIDCTWDAVLFGTVFIRKSAYKHVSYDEFRSLYGDNEFFYILYYYNYPVNKNSFKALYCTSSYPYGEVPSELWKERMRRGSWWRTKEKIFEVWCRDWIQAINWLEVLNNEEKKHVIMDHGIYGLMLGSANGWITLRKEKLVDNGTYRKYKLDIAQISTVPSWIICALSIIPPVILRLPDFARSVLRKLKHFLIRK